MAYLYSFPIQVICMDGDGSVIMHMGAMATIGAAAPPNYKHIIINNGAHDSVGGQPTDAENHEKFSFSAIALGCGYKKVCEMILIILSPLSYCKSGNVCIGVVSMFFMLSPFYVKRIPL